MSRSYDIFLSHSGAQKDFVEHLSAELARVCGQYSVFFDRDAIEHGEQISTTILEYARTCKLAVAVVSEEYFTRSRPPMMELAASYTAAKAGNGSPSLPCLLPVFLALHPEDAKDSSTQSRWRKMWQKWEVNEKMSERRKSRPSRVEPTVWKEAVDRLLDTRGPIYIPEEYGYDPEVFLKKVAQVIARKLDVLHRGVGPSKEVDPSEDTGVEEDSSENSGTDFWLVFNPALGTVSYRVATKVTDEVEAPPEPYSVIVCLEFGSTSSSFACSHIANPENIYTSYDYPGSGKRKPRCRTVTGIYYSSRDGGQSYQVDSWGNPALSSYERGQREAGRLSEKFFGVYVTRFNPHLKDSDAQISTTKKLKVPYSLPVDRPITDYLHEFGAYILHVLQEIYGLDLTMKMIQWCVPVPSSWDNAAQEKMKTCMVSAGLINGTDGSPYPVKVVGELEAASLWSLRCNELQRKVLVGDKLLVVDIGESLFEVVVQEVISVCNHIHRVKELSSSSFTRHSSPDIEFVRLLHRKIGPCLQDFLTEYPTEYQTLFNQWDPIKMSIGDDSFLRRGEPIEVFVPKRLAKILERYEQKSVPGIEWDSDDDGVIEIPYRECQSLFDPVIEELLSCISRTYTKVGGVGSLVLVGDWLAASPYVMDNIKQRFSSQVPEIISPPHYDTATCLGAVALAQDLCNDTSRTSSSTYFFDEQV